jgi:hypothetical protein
MERTRRLGRLKKHNNLSRMAVAHFSIPHCGFDLGQRVSLVRCFRGGPHLRFTKLGTPRRKGEKDCRRE